MYCRSVIEAVVYDLVDAELVVPKGKYDELVSYGATETLEEIIRGVGLSLRS